MNPFRNNDVFTNRSVIGVFSASLLIYIFTLGISAQTAMILTCIAFLYGVGYELYNLCFKGANHLDCLENFVGEMIFGFLFLCFYFFIGRINYNVLSDASFIMMLLCIVYFIYKYSTKER